MNIIVQGIDLSDAKNVMLLCPEHLGDGEALELRDILKERFPGCDFIILTGGFQVVATTKDDNTLVIEE